MSEFAQLPTPTIATRTLPSSIRWPLPAAPSCDPFSVLIRWEVLLAAGRSLYYAALVGRLHLGHVQRPQLTPHVPYTLHHGDRCQRSHSVDGRRQQLNVKDPGALGEHDADREQNYPYRPSGNPDLALDPEGLRPGTGVRDHQGAEHREHAGGSGYRMAGVREVPGDGRENDSLLDPVEGGVEERPEEGALAGHSGVATVERVHHRPDDEGQPAQHPQALRDEDCGHYVEHEPRDRDSVRGEARLDQAAAGIRPELLARTNIAKLATRNLRRHDRDRTGM